MSTYTPIPTAAILHRLVHGRLETETVHEQRLGDDEFMPGEPQTVSAIDLAADYDLSPVLIPQLREQLEGLYEFRVQLEGCFWAAVYGPDLVEKICLSVFGADLRLDVLRTRAPRSILISGAEGSGREAVGCSIIGLAAERLRHMGMNSSPSSAALSLQSLADDDQVRALFGRRASGETRAGFFTDLGHGWAFLDQVERLDETSKGHLAAFLRDEPGHGTTPMGPRGTHCIFGCQGRGSDSELGPELATLVTEDGHIRLPALVQLMATDHFWAVAFPRFYDRVARMVCGATYPSLHRIHQAVPSDESFMAADETEEAERSGYLAWITETERVETVGRIVRDTLEDHVWTGQLRRFQQLLRRIILNQGNRALDARHIADQCLVFTQGRAPVLPTSKQAPTWLTGLSKGLRPLPLNVEKLPQVMAAVECQYFREAARQAAVACAPKPAKMQDIAQILGIPRQTAARKWQTHGLSSALLAGVSEPSMTARQGANGAAAHP